jgi:NitT/TauT family transport system ATP-binding protein
VPASHVKARVAEVHRRFGWGERRVDALGPIDLEVADGEFLCVVGPSGCGKSTLLRLLAGLLRPSEGRVTIATDAAHPPGATAARRRRRQEREDRVVRPHGGGADVKATVSRPRSLTAMIFQDYGIYPWKTVRGNVRFGLDVQGVGEPEATRRADDWLGRMGLTDFADAWPDTLSGGMRQRVSIARALAVEPEILLMDEPFAALDAQLRSVLQEELLAVCQAAHRTVVFVTHSLEEAILLGDRVVVMSARPGRIIAERVVPFPRPRSAEVRTTAEFAALERELWHLLRGEVTRELSEMPAVPVPAGSGGRAATGGDRG